MHRDKRVLLPSCGVDVIYLCSVRRGPGKSVEPIKLVDLDPIRIHLDRVDWETDDFVCSEGSLETWPLVKIVLNNKIEVRPVPARFFGVRTAWNNLRSQPSRTYPRRHSKGARSEGE